jgi:hypothetical protein
VPPQDDLDSAQDSLPVTYAVTFDTESDTRKKQAAILVATGFLEQGFRTRSKRIGHELPLDLQGFRGCR